MNALHVRLPGRPTVTAALFMAALAAATPATPASTLAVRGETVYTMAGPPLRDAVILLRDGRIEHIGPAAQVRIPQGVEVIQAKVVTPGLIDAHTVIGLQGYLNEPREQDQLERSAAVQPGLRAADAFNGQEKLLEWVRGFGVTTIHTGPAPGALVPGQTMIIKTRGPTLDDGLLREPAMLCVTLGQGGLSDGGKAPGTRPKSIAMLRAEFIKAQEYDRKRAAGARKADHAAQQEETPPARDLRLEVFAAVLRKQMPLLITAHRAQDILLALKLAGEFDLDLVLDGAAEAYLLIDQIKAAGVPVVIHPTMYRAGGETENLSFETAARLHAAGIPVALQSGFERYVPKTRVVLFEAAIAAAHGLSFEAALGAITIDAARILGVADRVGSIEAGKDADLALFDGDPFEYTTHCVTTIVDGRVVSDKPN
jgi:imidazolonepropionase-like amidohydrolase